MSKAKVRTSSNKEMNKPWTHKTYLHKVQVRQSDTPKKYQFLGGAEQRICAAWDLGAPYSPWHRIEVVEILIYSLGVVVVFLVVLHDLCLQCWHAISLAACARMHRAQWETEKREDMIKRMLERRSVLTRSSTSLALMLNALYNCNSIHDEKWKKIARLRTRPSLVTSRNMIVQVASSCVWNMGYSTALIRRFVLWQKLQGSITDAKQTNQPQTFEFIFFPWGVCGRHTQKNIIHIPACIFFRTLSDLYSYLFSCITFSASTWCADPTCSFATFNILKAQTSSLAVRYYK